MSEKKCSVPCYFKECLTVRRRCLADSYLRLTDCLRTSVLTIAAIRVETTSVVDTHKATMSSSSLSSSSSFSQYRDPFINIEERLAQAVSCSCRQCLFTWRTVITEMRNIYVFAVCQKMCSIALLVSWEFHLCIRAYRCLTAKMEA